MTESYFIGFDLGSSSIKASLIEASTGKSIAVVQEPDREMKITALQDGWAEQNPEDWWFHVCTASKKLMFDNNIKNVDILGIGISYQMHGLVLVDDKGQLVRDSIIWCDSRAVQIGAKAFEDLGVNYCMNHLLNSPANFTASKLKWVKEFEPNNFNNSAKFMLPGDYIAFKLSGIINTTVAGLSEGVFWDFKNNEPSKALLAYYGISEKMIPEIVDTFSEQSLVNENGSIESGLALGTPILYRAGDQPNNALSLNVFHEGDVGATGGTSGVLYVISNSLEANEGVKFNNFAHVTHSQSDVSIGKLLNINGAGIQFRWLKDLLNLETNSYEEMNKLASTIAVGSNNLQIITFGNGAERMFDNETIGAHIANINFNIHAQAHISRAALEGIAFAFVYGMEILKNDNTLIKTIKAGNDNLFRSSVFSETIATLIDKEIAIYDTTGATGAARAAALSAGVFKNFDDIMNTNDHIITYQPVNDSSAYKTAYMNWKKELQKHVN